MCDVDDEACAMFTWHSVLRCIPLLRDVKRRYYNFLLNDNLNVNAYNRAESEVSCFMPYSCTQNFNSDCYTRYYKQVVL